MTSNRDATGNLNSCAFITRRYNIGDMYHFYRYFDEFEHSCKSTAWTYGLKRVRNKDIVKDARNISIEENRKAEERFQSFDKSTNEIYQYLYTDFIPKQFDLSDEKIERRFRQLLAHEYLKSEKLRLLKLAEKKPSIFKQKIITFISEHFFKILIISAVGFFSAPYFIKRLTPVDVLADKIYEKSRYKFDGAICNDGWTSHSQGRGTCSWHDGVNYYFYEGDYSKSWDECFQEATEISWLSP